MPDGGGPEMVEHHPKDRPGLRPERQRPRATNHGPSTIQRLIAASPARDKLGGYRRETVNRPATLRCSYCAETGLATRSASPPATAFILTGDPRTASRPGNGLRIIVSASGAIADHRKRIPCGHTGMLSRSVPQAGGNVTGTERRLGAPSNSPGRLRGASFCAPQCWCV
jgi:hypothetical protein